MINALKRSNEFINEIQQVEMYKNMFSKEKRRNMDPELVKELSNNLRTLFKSKNWKDQKLNEMFTSGKAEYMIPDIIIGTVLEGVDPVLQISNLFTTIQYTRGSATHFPALGELRAFHVPEGQEYPEQDFEMTQYRSLSIKVEKFGLMLRLTEEAIEDCQWDVIGYLMRAAGRAMARLKEQQCAHAMLMHGHVVFDTQSPDPQFRPTGVDANGNLNGTLSILDFIDLLAAVMYNEHTITDILIHPLGWLTFVKNQLIGGWGSKTNYFEIYGSDPSAVISGMGNPATPGAQIRMALPIPVNVNVSPYAPIDKQNNTFDIIAFDRNNLGVILQKENIMTEDFEDFNRDIYSIKFREKYGIGIVDQGRGIAVAKNISLAPTYHKPIVVNNIGN